MCYLFIIIFCGITIVIIGCLWCCYLFLFISNYITLTTQIGRSKVLNSINRQNIFHFPFYYDQHLRKVVFSIKLFFTTRTAFLRHLTTLFKMSRKISKSIFQPRNNFVPPFSKFSMEFFSCRLFPNYHIFHGCLTRPPFLNERNERGKKKRDILGLVSMASEVRFDTCFWVPETIYMTFGEKRTCEMKVKKNEDGLLRDYCLRNKRKWTFNSTADRRTKPNLTPQNYKGTRTTLRLC